MVHVKLAAGLSGFTHGFLGLALAADEEDALAFAGQFGQEFGGDIDLFNGFLEVQNVNLIAGFEDEGLHLGVPALGLVTKVDPGFDEFDECGLHVGTNVPVFRTPSYQGRRSTHVDPVEQAFEVVSAG